MTQQQSRKPRRQTIEQERGKEAWKDIQEVKSIKGMAKDYRPIARGLNAMIQINGLGQTLGFFYAKSKKDNGQPDSEKAHYRILNHLTNWMRGPFTPTANKIAGGYGGLLFWAIDELTTSADYRRATTECLAFGLWLSRFAEAELSDSSSTMNSTSGE